MPHIVTIEEVESLEDPANRLVCELTELVATAWAKERGWDRTVDEISAVYRGECEPEPDMDADVLIDDAHLAVVTLIGRGVICW